MVHRLFSSLLGVLIVGGESSAVADCERFGEPEGV
jgi:hypothetical protein